MKFFPKALRIASEQIEYEAQLYPLMWLRFGFACDASGNRNPLVSATQLPKPAALRNIISQPRNNISSGMKSIAKPVFSSLQPPSIQA
ncbi:MAG: hypothetical protein GY947_11725 [Rhodobacteraceae bacterium]|nr:hypothetical protein [Paracoccaceae bacterium]